MKLLTGLLHQGPPRCESTSIVWNVQFKKIHFCFAFLSHVLSLTELIALNYGHPGFHKIPLRIMF